MNVAQAALLAPWVAIGDRVRDREHDRSSTVRLEGQRQINEVHGAALGYRCFLLRQTGNNLWDVQEDGNVQPTSRLWNLMRPKAAVRIVGVAATTKQLKLEPAQPGAATGR